MEGMELVDPITRHEFDMLQEHIDEKLRNVNVSVGKLNASLDAMWLKLDGRPSWGVTMLLSGAGTIIGILTTSLITILMR